SRWQALFDDGTDTSR
nr:Chain B, WxxLF motif peptide [synthetic construct]